MQITADKGQESPRKRKTNTSTAADTRPPKRQNVSDRPGNVQPEPRRSTRPPRPSDWVKEAR